MVAEDKRPTPEMVRAGFRSNDRGAGFAWRVPVTEQKGKKSIPVLNDDGSPKMKVRWKKAITDIEEAVKLSQELPLPYVLHCRIPSIGGPNIDLTHPFPVCKDVRLDHEGEIEGDVLFHNGTWSKYDSEMFKAALLRGVKLPRGPFSDSRMMAWLDHLLGHGFLDAIEEKVIIFGPYEIEIFGQNKGWECVNDIWCSNGGFRRHLDPPKRQEPTVLGPVAQRQQGNDGRGGDRHDPSFRTGPSQMANARSQEAGENLQGGDEGRPWGVPKGVQKGLRTVNAAVSNVGETRHALASDDEFLKEYRRLHGHAPPFAAARLGNPKKYRSSGAPGDDATTLAQHRANAAKGISSVIM